MCAIERLNVYLYGGHFTLVTDCKPIKMILANPKSKPPARIEQWNLKVQDYDFSIQDMKGLDNPSDFLSCHLGQEAIMPVSQLQNIADMHAHFMTEHAVRKAMTLMEIQEATTSDPTLQYLIHVIIANKWNSISSAQMNVNNTAVSQSDL